MGLLVQFSYLQVLDFLTTLAFLSVGVEEANPFVNFMFRVSGHPLQALMLVKTIAILIGVYCWRAGRHSVLLRANQLFAALVVWNIVALLVVL